MTAKELYLRETGRTEPNHQIAYYEWHQQYVKWLETKVERSISVN